MPNTHIEFDAFLLGLRATDKKQILQNLSWKIGRLTDIDMTWLSDQLLNAEANETSAIGDGIAIPHLKSSPLKKPFILLARLDEPVDFDAVDGRNVDIVCIVCGAQMDGPAHLQRLARVTRLFRDSEIVDKIRAAKSEGEMAKILQISCDEKLAA